MRKRNYLRIIKFLCLFTFFSLGVPSFNSTSEKVKSSTHTESQTKMIENNITKKCLHIYKSVLDRTEDDVAVFLIEEEKEEFILSQVLLPKGSKEGDWFVLCKKKTQFTLHKAEALRKVNKEKSQSLLNQLQNKKRTSY